MPRRDQSVERCGRNRYAEIRAEIAVKMHLFQRNNGRMVAVISDSPKAVMVANMLMLVMLVGGWR